MQNSIDEWLEELTEDVSAAEASAAFQEWLDVQSRFHDYSARNTLLIQLQCPGATKVAGYRAWQSEFDRHVCEGESAIWIWAPIITRKCPGCGNSPSYHESSECEHDETEPAEWAEGLVGFRPAPVFDVSQTEGEPLPELETAAVGEADGLVAELLDAGAQLGFDVAVVADDEWSHGDARGVCRYEDAQPVVEVVERENEADLAMTLVHEYAHALLHDGGFDDPEQAAREVEAEAVAYVVGRACGLDMSGSAFYLAAWRDDDAGVLRERVDRIGRTADRILAAVDATR